MKVLTLTLSPFPQLSVTAASSSHSGGSGAAIAVIIIVVIAIVGGFYFWFNHNRSASEETHQAAMRQSAYKTELLKIVAANETDCKKVCIWLAADGRPEHQQALYQALQENGYIPDGDNQT
jgi:uncharacterized protein HemX